MGCRTDHAVRLGPLSAMKRGTLLVLALLLSGATSSCFRQTRVPDAGATTICTVAANPDAFNGRTIRVKALVRSDGFEVMQLFDKSCPEHPLAIVSEKPRSNPSLRAFSDVVFGRNRGRLNGEVDAAFVGVFRWRSGRVPSRTIELINVSNLHFNESQRASGRK
jgi:hypothetical protein